MDWKFKEILLRSQRSCQKERTNGIAHQALVVFVCKSNCQQERSGIIGGCPPWGEGYFYGIVAIMNTSIRKNHGRLRMAKLTNTIRNWSRYFSFTNFESKTFLATVLDFGRSMQKWSLHRLFSKVSCFNNLWSLKAKIVNLPTTFNYQSFFTVRLLTSSPIPQIRP